MGSGTASPVSAGSAYVSISAIKIYNSSQTLISTITTGMPTVDTITGAWSFVWSGGSSSTTYYAKATAKSSDTSQTTADSAFSSSITTSSSFITPYWNGTLPKWNTTVPSNFQRTTTTIRWGWDNGTFSFAGSVGTFKGWNWEVRNSASGSGTLWGSSYWTYSTGQDTRVQVNGVYRTYLIYSGGTKRSVGDY